MRGDFTRSTFDPGKRYSGVRLQQGRVQLDADWNEQVDIDAHLRETGVRDLVGPCGAPRQGGGFRITATGDGRDLSVSAGRFYVDGLLCELAAPATYREQPDLPEPAAAQAGVHFVYLDVWRHHVTALEDPAIRETALGGPDTATRTRTVCQVRLLRVAEANQAGQIHCLSDPEPWRQLTAPRSARMRARTQEGTLPTDPCVVPADAGYTRLENQLYRIEVHRGGALGEATFKWSRENGSLVTGWTAQNGNELTVESVGRDRVLGFAEGSWIELTDEERELRGEPGLFVQISSVEGNVLAVDPGGQAISRADFPLQPKVRRWDGELRTVETPAANDGWLDIEQGISIRFEGTGFRTGDYWLIPARAFIGGNGGEIEWPRQGDDWLAKPPDGIEHHYCKVAVASFDGTSFGNILDCRPQWAALTELIHLAMAGGDGQEAPPATELPCSLAVGVTNGRWPVEGARVRFEVGPGHGSLRLDGGNQGVASVTLPTSADGIATCRWTLPERFDGDETTCLQVTARLLDAAGQPIGTPVFFHARFLLGGETQDAGIHVRGVFAADGDPIDNDGLVDPRRLLRGLRVSCDAPLSPEPFERSQATFPDATPSRPVCVLTVDLPYPFRGEGLDFWDSPVFGFRPLHVAATLQARETEILWTPTEIAARWLSGVLQRFRDQQITDRLLVHLTLKGNSIWHRDRRNVFLDGNAFGRVDRGGRIGLDFPSGDGRRGGDFEMWFWLALPAAPPQPGIRIDAQGALNAITGTVLDAATGAAIAGAVVTLGGPAGVPTRTATTSANGQFRFVDLPAGQEFTLRAQAPDGRAATTTASTTVLRGTRPVRDIPGVGDAFAGRLNQAGITTVDQVVALQPARLAQILGNTPAQATAIIQAARQLVNQ